jgi:hypothetical protein
MGVRIGIVLMAIIIFSMVSSCIESENNNEEKMKDSDGDEIPDDLDMFPDDPNEWSDMDGDGIGDNSDAFLLDPNEWEDSDGDGVGDNGDEYPNDPEKWEEEPEEENGNESSSDSNGTNKVYNEACLKRSGWIDAEEETPHTEDIHLDVSNIYKITFHVYINDSNEEHAETDEGSNPDWVATAVEGGKYKKEKEGQTPFLLDIGWKSDAFLPNDWIVSMEAIECNGGKAYGPTGRIEYVDQGVAWTICVDYTYITYE